MENEISPT